MSAADHPDLDSGLARERGTPTGTRPATTPTVGGTPATAPRADGDARTRHAGAWDARERDTRGHYADGASGRAVPPPRHPPASTPRRPRRPFRQPRSDSHGARRNRCACPPNRHRCCRHGGPAAKPTNPPAPTVAPTPITVPTSTGAISDPPLPSPETNSRALLGTTGAAPRLRVWESGPRGEEVREVVGFDERVSKKSMKRRNPFDWLKRSGAASHR